MPKAVSLSWSARVQVSGEEEEEGGWGVCVCVDMQKGGWIKEEWAE